MSDWSFRPGMIVLAGYIWWSGEPVAAWAVALGLLIWGLPQVVIPIWSWSRKDPRP